MVTFPRGSGVAVGSDVPSVSHFCRNQTHSAMIQSIAYCLIPLCGFATLAAAVNEHSVASPNGSTVFKVAREESSGALAFSVTQAGRPVISGGSLGLEIAGQGVVGATGNLGPAVDKRVSTSWQNPFGEQAVVADQYTEQTYPIEAATPNPHGLKLQVRAYDAGIAFRYLLDGSGTVVADKTRFSFAATTQVWTSARAQSPITKQAISEVKGAVDRPLLAELAADQFAALGEAGLVAWARMKFTRSGDTALAATLDGKVEFSNGTVSPWRYVRVASTPIALLQDNDFMLNLNEPCKIADTSWIRPGQVLREVTLTTQGALASINFAASHGLQYIMFDAGWYGPEGSAKSDATEVNLDPARSRGPLDLPAVLAAGKKQKIGVILYVNQIALSRQLDQLLPLYQSWGVAGIKFGFVNVGSQAATRWLHEAVAKCAAHRLMVDIHDEYRPTGVSRTWPNLLTQEGIRGDEETATNPAVLDTIFTRCLAGAGDQTNCYFAPRIAKMGSHASQLAKSGLIFSPWQFLFWYDRPPVAPGGTGAGGSGSIIQEVTELEFFKRLPTTWEESRWIEGYPGRFASVARRQGQAWFVGALNGPEPRDFRLPLGFLTAGRDYTLELYSDDPQTAGPTHVKREVSVVNSTTVITRSVAANNGFAAVLSPVIKR